MAELQHQVHRQADLYERLIDRLGLALDMAKTAIRLRNEYPAEVELRGLSLAELQFIEAYLSRREKDQAVLDAASLYARAGWSSSAWEPSAPARGLHSSANVFWLKDLGRAKVSAKLSRYSSSKHFKR